MTNGASAAKAESDVHLTESVNETVDIDTGAELIERSMRNISAWRSYLPAECVDTMIAMGWDKTT